jgi:hypothetical protein
MRWTAILCAALVAACAPKDEGVTVARLPDGSYRLTLKAADLTDAVQGQQLLLPAAIQLCGERGIAFGAHALDKQGALPRLVQDMRCETPIAQPAATSFSPSDADERTVADLSERFLKVRDTADLAGAREMFPPEWPEAAQKSWVADLAAFDRVAGKGTKQAISRISWFENPPAAPAPGVYAAVDYARTFERVKTACGFIVWRRQADGGWRIDREKLSYLTPEQEARARRADLPEIRAQLGCR